MQTIYDVVGEDGFQRLVHAFYRQVPADAILGPMYPPDDMAGAAIYLASRAGAYLTGVQAKWTDGSDFRNGVSVDQVIANDPLVSRLPVGS